jgi:hypothetical protein
MNVSYVIGHEGVDSRSFPRRNDSFRNQIRFPYYFFFQFTVDLNGKFFSYFVAVKRDFKLTAYYIFVTCPIYVQYYGDNAENLCIIIHKFRTVFVSVHNAWRCLCTSKTQLQF